MEKIIKDALANMRKSIREAKAWLAENPMSREVVIMDSKNAYLHVISHDEKTLVTTFNMWGSGVSATGFKKEIAQNCIRKWKIDASTKSRRVYLKEHIATMEDMIKTINASAKAKKTA